MVYIFLSNTTVLICGKSAQLPIQWVQIARAWSWSFSYVVPMLMIHYSLLFHHCTPSCAGVQTQRHICLSLQDTCVSRILMLKWSERSVIWSVKKSRESGWRGWGGYGLCTAGPDLQADIPSCFPCRTCRLGFRLPHPYLGANYNASRQCD
jgi:hypothetical protein